MLLSIGSNQPMVNKGFGGPDEWMMVTVWPPPRMITIIHLVPGSTKPEVYMVQTLLGKPVPFSSLLDSKSGVTNFILRQIKLG